MSKLKSPDRMEAEAILHLTSLPEWKHLLAYLSRRREICRERLEETSNPVQLHQDQGRSQELSHLLDLEKVANNSFEN